MNKPSSTIQAAGIGGLLVGVPVGGYLGSITMGLITVLWPEVAERLDAVVDLQSSISGVFTIIIAALIGYFKKENVIGNGNTS